MVKASNPFLRGLLRAGKKQQRSAVRMLGTLLAPPKPAAKARAKPKPRLAAGSTTVAPLKTKAARPAGVPRAVRAKAPATAAPAARRC